MMVLLLRIIYEVNNFYIQVFLTNYDLQIKTNYYLKKLGTGIICINLQFRDHLILKNECVVKTLVSF